MAEGWLRSDFLRLPAGTELHVPDFTRLLNDAVIGSRSEEGLEISVSTRSKEDVARSARRDLEAFRIIGTGFGFTPVMVELAIFDDELLQIAIDPSERVASRHADGQPRLEFISVSASYEEFKENSSLLRAWHRASTLVVDRDKESTVGERRTYDYAYLSDHLDREEIMHAAADAQLFEGHKEPSAAVALDDLANVMPPVRYSLGADAIRRIVAHWGQVKNRTADSDEALNRDPTEIVHNLMSYFAAAAYYEKSDTILAMLEKTVLLVVPFTRPWLFGRDDPSTHQQQSQRSRPGGGVFMILKVNTDLMADKNSLEISLTQLSSALDYVMFQAGMLEAQQQRAMTRETDLSLFGHTVSAQLRQARTDCSRAVEAALNGDSRVLTYTNSAHDAVLRLEQASQIARTCVLMRSGRAAPYSFISGAISFAEFQAEFAGRCRLAMLNAQDVIRDPARALAVAKVTYEPIEWHNGVCSPVKTDYAYIEMLVNELMRNALRHGDFNDSQQIKLEVTCDGKYVYLEVLNPIRRNKEQRQELNNMLARKSLSLGITQIETLASTYRVPLPCFSVLEADFSVKCVVAEKIVAVPCSSRAGAQ